MVLPIASISTHPPVSVCGTGPGRLPRGFSREHGLTRFVQVASSGASGTWHPRFARCRPTRHRGDVQNPAELPSSVAPSVVAPPRGCRNVDLPCVGYAFRPRLSPRLTLGGLALPRKPWVHGGGVSSRRSRYSCQHPHSRQVHRGSSPLRLTGKLYHRTGSRSRRFGINYSPVYCRRMSTRPVSCYALFEWVAASEPTSWLSGQTHILCHSARTWGPWRAVWAVSLSNTQLSPHVLTPGLRALGIRSSVGFGRR